MGSSVWGVYLAVRGFSTWGGCPSFFAVNQAVGCISFGLCRRDGWVWAVVLGGGGMLVGCCHLSSLGAAISGVGLLCCLVFVLDGS